MRHTFKLIRTSLLYLSALLLVAGYPLMAMADTPVTTATPTTNTVDTTAAPVQPTYTYNPVTGTWDSDTWHFNATTGTYQAAPPAVPTVVDPPAPVPVAIDQPINNAQAATDPATSESSAATTAQSGIDVNNQVGSAAVTGDATVAANTAAGNATTGDAVATTTLLNNVNSLISAGDNQKVANFTYNVMGDVTGDIMLYPLLLKSMLESGAHNSPVSNTIAATQTNTVTNDLNLQAATGNASVTGNTSAGNATTGSAHAVANVMNILNSMISANQSFIGTINIYGSLNGDILVAPDFIPQMIASNKTLQSVPASATSVKTSDTQSIVNNVTLAAQSGAAAVMNNTNAGNATTGSATTDVVIFNLTGHAIIAKNSLLVFVNVLGKWVGVIVDAPSGATSALIGNGVVSDVVSQPDLTVTAQTTNAITNTITLTAQSGDATVKSNTSAGSAMSGNATASANIANISGSQLGISDWFGVLFINVFNSWYGSFGINTAYGDPPVVGTSSTDAPSQPRAIAFLPHTFGSIAAARKVTIIGPQQGTQDQPPTVGVLGADANDGPTNSAAVATSPTANPRSAVDYRFPIMIGSMLVIGISGVALRRLFTSNRGTGIAGVNE